MAVKVDAHIDFAVVAGIFHRHIDTQRSEMAVEHAGIVAFVLGNRVVSVPVVGQTGIQRFEVDA